MNETRTKGNKEQTVLQVHPDDLDSGDADVWTGWRRKESLSLNNATQVIAAMQNLFVFFKSE